MEQPLATTVRSSNQWSRSSASISTAGGYAAATASPRQQQPTEPAQGIGHAPTRAPVGLASTRRCRANPAVKNGNTSRSPPPSEWSRFQNNYLKKRASRSTLRHETEEEEAEAGNSVDEMDAISPRAGLRVEDLDMQMGESSRESSPQAPKQQQELRSKRQKHRHHVSMLQDSTNMRISWGRSSSIVCSVELQSATRSSSDLQGPQEQRSQHSEDQALRPIDAEACMWSKMGNELRVERVLRQEKTENGTEFQRMQPVPGLLPSCSEFLERASGFTVNESDISETGGGCSTAEVSLATNSSKFADDDVDDFFLRDESIGESRKSSTTPPGAHNNNRYNIDVRNVDDQSHAHEIDNDDNFLTLQHGLSRSEATTSSTSSSGSGSPLVSPPPPVWRRTSQQTLESNDIRDGLVHDASKSCTQKQLSSKALCFASSNLSTNCPSTQRKSHSSKIVGVQKMGNSALKESRALMDETLCPSANPHQTSPACNATKIADALIQVHRLLESTGELAGNLASTQTTIEETMSAAPALDGNSASMLATPQKESSGIVAVETDAAKAYRARIDHLEERMATESERAAKKTEVMEIQNEKQEAQISKLRARLDQARMMVERMSNEAEAEAERHAALEEERRKEAEHQKQAMADRSRVERSLRSHIEQLRSQLEEDHKAHKQALEKQKHDFEKGTTSTYNPSGSTVEVPEKMQHLQQQLADAMHRERSLRKSNERMREKLSTVQKENTEIKEAAATAKKRSDARHNRVAAEHASLRENAHKMDAQVQKLRSRLDAAKDEVQRLRNERSKAFGSLQRQVTLVGDENHKLGAQNQSLLLQVRQLQSQVQQYKQRQLAQQQQQQKQARTSDVSETDRLSTDAKKALEQANAREAKLKSALRQLEDENKALFEQMEVYESVLREQEQELMSGRHRQQKHR